MQISRNRKKVLIADDEPGMRITLADILDHSGFEVSTAADGESAIAMCQREAFDCVLMDVRMPGIDGVEAFRQIRQIQKQVRVILMSAWGDEDLKHEALRQGAIAFLDKPLNLDLIIQLVANSTAIAILAVTNDEELTSFLPEAFRGRDQQLTIAHSPKHACDLLTQLNFDVVLIDVNQPNTNGLECYLELRKINSSITAIMISSRDNDLMQLAEEAVRNTAYTVITRPLNEDTFSNVMSVLRAQRLSGSVRKPGISKNDTV